MKSYPSKVLLFGEYGILYGSRALAMPFNFYSGQFEEDMANRNAELLPILKHIEAINSELLIPLDLQKLNNDVGQGLFFNSSIPLNSGLGSSGALVAALYESYSSNSDLIASSSLEKIKNDLALIESHFHGQSSGFDPLVSLINKPLLMDASREIRKINKMSLTGFDSPIRLFLFNSMVSGKTKGLVNSFTEKMQAKDFADVFRKSYQLYSDGAIEQILNNKYNKFFEVFASLSEFQLTNMAELIPESVKELFVSGLNTGNYYLKICGSGGGGHFLGITPDFEKLSENVKNNSIEL